MSYIRTTLLVEQSTDGVNWKPAVNYSSGTTLLIPAVVIPPPPTLSRDWSKFKLNNYHQADTPKVQTDGSLLCGLSLAIPPRTTGWPWSYYEASSVQYGNQDWGTATNAPLPSTITLSWKNLSQQTNPQSTDSNQYWSDHFFAAYYKFTNPIIQGGVTCHYLDLESLLGIYSNNYNASSKLPKYATWGNSRGLTTLHTELERFATGGSGTVKFDMQSDFKTAMAALGQPASTTYDPALSGWEWGLEGYRVISRLNLDGYITA